VAVARPTSVRPAKSNQPAFETMSWSSTTHSIVVFALADAFQIRLQAIGVVDIPPQFRVMLPYLVTLVALAVPVRRTRPPSALGVNYVSS
jgi:ABC-type uncharacterized transport system permease subunit